MNRVDYESSNQCCCCIQNNTRSPSRNIKFMPENGDIVCDNRSNGTRFNTSSPYYQPSDRRQGLTNQTLQNLSSFREKACNFIKLESDHTTTSGSSYFNPCLCKSEKCSREACLDRSVLRKAQELIDYIPQSTFLRKMKERSDSYQNGHRTDNQSSAYCGTVEVETPLCERCLENAHRRLDEQQIRFRPVSYDSSRCCENCTNRNSDADDLQYILSACKSAIEEYKNSINGMKQCRCDDCMHMKEEVESENNNKIRKSKGRSKRGSKSKKHRKERRKRKTNDLERIESHDSFEPSLKRPHENSCERCWRYASPSRSPVNKPDQRYDPNFRKSHSCTELGCHLKGEKGYENTEIVEASNLTYSQPKSMPPSNAKTPEAEHAPLPYRETEVKELMFKPVEPKSIGRSYHKLPTLDNIPLYESPPSPPSPRSTASPMSPPSPASPTTPKSPRSPRTPVIQSKKKPRPKSLTPGTSNKVNFHSPKNNSADPMKLIYHATRPESNAGDLNYGLAKGSVRDSVFHKENGLNFSDPCEPIPKQTINSPRSPSRRPGSSRSPGLSNNSQANKRLGSGSNKNSGSKSNRPQTSPSPRRTRGRGSADRGNALSSPKQQKKSASPKSLRIKQDVSSPSPKKEVNNVEEYPLKRMLSSFIVHEDQTKNCEPKSRTAERGAVLNNDVYDEDTEEMPDQSMTSHHPFRRCECNCQYPQGRMMEIRDQSPRRLYCCHCNRKENMRNQTFMSGSSSVSHPNCPENGRPFVQTVQNYNNFENNPVVNRNNYYSNRQTEKHLMNNFSGKSMPCPYVVNYTSKVPLVSHADDDKDTQKHEQIPPRNNNLDNQSTYNPTKYCVYYMTKTKDKGQEVEVLVEELTERCSDDKKTSKTKALKNKMERLSQCHSDSMALRFQKGVSDSYKSSQNSRILYF